MGEGEEEEEEGGGMECFSILHPAFPLRARVDSGFVWGGGG